VSQDRDASRSAWTLAQWAVALFAVDPVGTGMAVRARSGPQRDALLAQRSALMPGCPIRKVPAAIADDRLLGGLDLAATLAAGHAIAEKGVLAESDRGVILLPSAERMPGSLAARIASVHDRGEVRLERDGLTQRQPARFGMILMDEGLDGDEDPPAALLDRLAFRPDLTAVSHAETATAFPVSPDDVALARERFDTVAADDETIEAICTASAALGIGSARAPILALRAAKAAAALDGSLGISGDHLSLAAQLVLAWRAQSLPQDTAEDDQPDETPEPDEQNAQDEEPSPAPDEEDALNDVIVAAARAALPPDLLARLIAERGQGNQTGQSGHAGALQKSGKRGRRVGVVRSDPRGGARLDVVATLRAAAPWQRIRSETAVKQRTDPRLKIRASDFRTIRYAERRETLTIFAVDASGSLALNRLAEAKGAIELLLADCYVRRDQVSLIAFRGRKAELLLPPTRSLTRAKRSLSALPGGGGTPLAAGVDAAMELAQSALRRGQTPLIVMLTDGRANITRNGQAGRPAAQADAQASAKVLRAARLKSMLIDTAPRPDPRAEELAGAMGATYIALPQVDANLISSAVQGAWSRSGAAQDG